jgi:hypothetical protein
MSFEYTGDGHQPADESALLSNRPPPALDVDAFRELHGRLLYGFALLISLGDRDAAARWSAAALGAFVPANGELRHPERAAAWLRARVVSDASRGLNSRGSTPSDRADALRPLNVDDAMIHALSALELRQRAALVAHDVERLQMRDVSTIVGARDRALARMLTRARARFIDAYLVEPGADARADGRITAHIRDTARRVLA